MINYLQQHVTLEFTDMECPGYNWMAHLKTYLEILG